MESNEVKGRDSSLDIVRIVACMMVVFIHCPPPVESVTPHVALLYSTISYIATPCIGLFFILSGALLLPIKSGVRVGSFLRKRFTKIVVPALFWTIIYVGYAGCRYDLSAGALCKSLLSIPFSEQEGVLWFVYTLMGLYLLVPILSPWIKLASGRQMQAYLCLWLVTLVYPYLENMVNINQSITGPLYYFSGYVGYFVLGYYLYRHCDLSRFNMWAFVVLIVCMGLPIPFKVLNIQVDFYRVFWFLSFPVAMMSVCWFVLLRNVSRSHRKFIDSQEWISRVSSLTFGVYLSHILLRKILFESGILRGLDPIVGVMASFFILLFGSFALCYMLSKVRYTKILIGI